MQNRQKDEIMRDILQAAQGGAGITKIMFHAFLTHGQAKEYTHLLMENGLLALDTESSSMKQYRTTHKGIEYLAAIGRMSDMLPIPTRRSTGNSAFQF
ncbi:MAG: winged helix-turn-helix domain-containing protein [Nitrososphaera sp.]